jgi:glutamate synthase (NADPH) large chain
MPSYDVSTLPLNMYRSLNIENYVNLNSICPPPHYDMYSIEDVAQLIMDLKHSNPRARISINLTSKLGVGVIAVGCMKAKADHIIISGSPHHTTKNEFHYLGLPWEIGLAETHQTLCLNGLRNRVSLQVNGGLSTGRDVIVAALLGAEEFGFETCSMLSLNNTTDSFNSMMPSSLTQQENEFFKQFEGPARHLVYYFYMVAQEVRLYMAQLGFHEFNQMIGRSDLLCPKQSMQCHWKRSGFDFHQTLMPGWKLVSPINRWLCSSDQFVPRSMHCMMAQDHELDKVLDREIIRRAKSSLEHRIKTFMLFPIRNVDRSVGGLLSHEIIKRYGSETLPHETIKVKHV